MQLLAATGTYQVNFAKLETSVTSLVRDICTWQHNGDKAVVDEVFQKYGAIGQATQDALNRSTS